MQRIKFIVPPFSCWHDRGKYSCKIPISKRSQHFCLLLLLCWRSGLDSKIGQLQLKLPSVCNKFALCTISSRMINLLASLYCEAEKSNRIIKECFEEFWWIGEFWHGYCYPCHVIIEQFLNSFYCVTASLSKHFFKKTKEIKPFFNFCPNFCCKQINTFFSANCSLQEFLPLRESTRQCQHASNQLLSAGWVKTCNIFDMTRGPRSFLQSFFSRTFESAESQTRSRKKPKY